MTASIRRTPYGYAPSIRVIPIDQQVAALVTATGHTIRVAAAILNELRKIGWTVRPLSEVEG